MGGIASVGRASRRDPSRGGGRGDAVPVEEGDAYWSHTGRGSISKTTVTWLIAGAPPDWQGAPLAMVDHFRRKQSTSCKTYQQISFQDRVEPINKKASLH